MRDEAVVSFTYHGVSARLGHHAKHRSVAHSACICLEVHLSIVTFAADLCRCEISDNPLHVHRQVVPHQLVEKGLVVDALDDELALADVLESLPAVSEIENLRLADLEHVNEQHDQTVVFVLHQEDPFEDAGGNMKWDMRAEAQSVDREAVHVLPDIEARAAPSFRIKRLVQCRHHFRDFLMELLDFGVFTLVLSQIVLAPVKIEHKLDQEVIDLDFALVEEFEEARDDVDVALVFQVHHRVRVVVGAHDPH